MSNEINNFSTTYPVPVATAAADTAAWRTFIAGVTQDPNYLINAFFIPIGDISNTIQYAVNGFRAYMGMREDGTLHLYWVAVDADGNDVLEDSNNNSLVFDSTFPCPTCCGQSNALNSTQ
ncbi:MAG: hypothetical protein IAE95_12215 [Chitinophagaceae bacterium]|nr:hypothetical protein [Chitinophagaceae bacterium]